MSYVVIQVRRFKESDVKGIQAHNQKERMNSKKSDIDCERSALYYDFHNHEPINYDHRVKEIIRNGYFGTRKVRKDATVIVGTVITSDKDFFGRLNFIEQKKFFQDAYDYLKERYGEKNIVAAVVHLDEKYPPHMHAISVPITEDGRLSASSLFTLKSLIELHDELPKLLQDKGFDIKKGSLRSEKTNADPVEKQIIKDLENENSALQAKIISLQNDLKAVEAKLNTVLKTNQRSLVSL